MPTRNRFALLGPAFLVLLWILPGQASDPADDKTPAEIRLRRPIALTLVDSGKRLLVANRDSGTIAIVDTRELRVVAETRFGSKLSDMTASRNHDFILVTDEGAGEVIVLAQRRDSLREVSRWKVGLSPVSVRISSDGQLATVACLWPRRLMILDLTVLTGKTSRQAANTVPAVIDLPFAPRRQVVVPGTRKLLVADSFAGKLAVVDLQRKKMESLRNLPAHNIRGLSLDRERKSLWLTHQVLHAQGHPTPGDIRSGSLISNNVRKMSLASLLDPVADVMRDDRLFFLGDVDRGAGDPADVVETDNGEVLVALAGVNELAIGRPEQATWSRLAVGHRPTALAVDDKRQRAYVANTFADSISVVDLQARKVIAEVRLGPARDLRPEERGETLFHDARLSFEAWFSCHSCHSDGHTNGGLNDNFTDGSFGTPKRVLSVLGVKDTRPWAWNGRMHDLGTQIRTSLTSTMRGQAPSAEQVQDLTAFLEKLPAPRSVLGARKATDSESLERGRRVFARQKCDTCHTPPTYTSLRTYDVGLRDEAGGSHFNPPSLRGLSQAGPFFHDGRALTLEEVFTRYRHQLSGKLSKEDLNDLMQFLSSL
jgi:YVTN family beta-propeller protein